jgi:hypothetical protein
MTFLLFPDQLNLPLKWTNELWNWGKFHWYQPFTASLLKMIFYYELFIGGHDLFYLPCDKPWEADPCYNNCLLYPSSTTLYVCHMPKQERLRVIIIVFSNQVPLFYICMCHVANQEGFIFVTVFCPYPSQTTVYVCHVTSQEKLVITILAFSVCHVTNQERLSIVKLHFFIQAALMWLSVMW